MSSLLRTCLLSVWLMAGFASLGWSQTGATTEEEQRERVAAERYRSLLERQPRLGTALDKVYGYHIERGTLDEFVAGLKEQTNDAGKAGVAWMILGMIEQQRGHDADAVEAFTQADKLRETDALASYYLGRSLLLVGRPDDAAAAYERALDRTPTKPDFLEIAQSLGRLHQRAQRAAAALKVWDRLEQAFPDDLRVQEQIASILAEEGDVEGSLARFEAMSQAATDPYRQVQYQLKTSELKLKLGKNAEALKELEGLLARLKPDSWLHRDVRQKIEDTFLRTDDYDGLAKYYAAWLEKHPDDLDAISRLGKVLALQGRTPEAEEQYRRAIKVAPSNKTLRHALIDLLAGADRIPDALKEYAELDKLEPNNPDTLRAWGSLILEDPTQNDSQKRSAAVAVWKRLLIARPKDPVIASQVADLLRGAKLSQEAIELYQQAVTLAPTEPQYREYLGEYLHSLDRGDEAVAVWKEIAAGKLRNTRNLVRLAEVLRGFGYREESLKTLGDACTLDPEFSDILRYAELLQEAQQYDESLQQLDRATKMAENDDERDQILVQRIKVFVESEKLPDEIAALEKVASAGGSAADWRTLAMYYEAARQPSEAGAAIAKSLESDPQSISTWLVASRIYETSGLIDKAVEANEKLATLDRRGRSDYLERIANLNLRLGRIDAALKAAQDVVAAAPGNPEAYQFYAGICFNVGRREEGLDALRRSVRANPSDAQSLLALAAALGEQFRTDEAIELYWRAFDTAEDLDSRTGVINSLAELYLRTNQFERLASKLERIGQEQKAEREASFWLAAAYQASGDIGAARQTLESLLTDDSRDTQLLTQLVRLADTEYDLDQAIAYQRKIQELAPSRESQQQLAMLLLRGGDADEAEEILLDLASGDKEPHKIYDAIDDMLRHSRFDAALKLCDKLLRTRSDDWEALYRSGVALWKKDDKDGALERLQRLALLKLPDDQMSAKAEYQKAQAAKRPATTQHSQNLSSNARMANMANYPQFIQRQQMAYQVMQVFDERYASRNYGMSGMSWSPDDFGQAKWVAPCARFIKRMGEGNQAAGVAEVEARLAEPNLAAGELWELAAVSQLTQYYQQNNTGRATQMALMSKVAERLADTGDVDGKFMYLMTARSLQSRPVVRGNTVVVPEAEPIPEEEMEKLLSYYRDVIGAYPEFAQMYGMTAVMVNFLKASKREAQAEQMYLAVKQQAQDATGMQQAFQLALALGKTDDLLELAEKLSVQPPAQMQYAGFQVGLWSQIASTLVQNGEREKLPLVVTRALAAQAQQIDDRPSYSRVSSQTGNNRYYIQSGSPTTGYRHTEIDFPMPNDYFDQSTIQLLYTVFDDYKQQQAVDDLQSFLSTHADEASGTEQVLTRLAGTYMAWWNGDQPAAVDRLEDAVELTPDNVGLRMQLASLLMQRNQPKAALDQLESLKPMDHTALRDRELLAVQAAVAVGDVDRARKGAERLSGLQLDANLQFQLSQLMHQLGMHEQAETMLGRMRRRSGNQTNILVQVMQEYANRGNSEIAGQIAHQLLRRSRPAPSQGPNRGMTQDMAARKQALQILQRTAQLKGLIERVEGQLERSPNSPMLLQTLAEYYEASGDSAKSQEVLGRLSKQEPDDAKALYAIANRLVASGKHSEACDAYLKAIVKDPSELENGYWNVQNTFRQAKRMNDLAKVFETIDLKGFQRGSYVLTNIVSNMLQDQTSREAGMTLFRRVWKDAPDLRTQMLSQVYDNKLWETEEFYNYAREAVIPKDGNVNDPWSGLVESMSWNSDGKVTTLLTRLVQATKKPERREQLTTEVAAALEKATAWRGGEAILAVLEGHAGKAKESGARIEQLLKDPTMPGNVCLTIGQELTDVEALRPRVIELLEKACSDPNMGGPNEFSYHPRRSLARIYGLSGDQHKAREEILKLLEQQDFSRYGSSNPGYPEYQELQSLHAAGQDFLTMKMPLDALRLYNKAAADPGKFQAASRWGGTYLEQQIENGRKAATTALTSEVLAASLAEWIRPPSADADKQDTKKPAAPVVDFALSVQPRAADTATIVSLFETALTVAAGQAISGSPTAQKTTAPPATNTPAQAALQLLANAVASAAQRKVAEMQAPKPQPDVFVRLRQQLAEAGKSSDDPSILVASLLVTLVSEPAADATLLAASLHKLSAAVEAAPAPKGKAESQLATAAWLVARRAQRHADEGVKLAGGGLAERCVNAARGHSDSIWLLAMLREEGQIAVDAGDREAAERRWTDMLDVILKRAKPADAKTSQSTSPFGALAPAVAVP